jgi:hypothetical protein
MIKIVDGSSSSSRLGSVRHGIHLDSAHLRQWFRLLMFGDGKRSLKQHMWQGSLEVFGAAASPLVLDLQARGDPTPCWLRVQVARG